MPALVRMQTEPFRCTLRLGHKVLCRTVQLVVWRSRTPAVRIVSADKRLIDLAEGGSEQDVSLDDLRQVLAACLSPGQLRRLERYLG